MHRQVWLWGAAALGGICSAVLLFATTFQLVPVSPTDILQATWPTGTVTADVTTVTWSLNPSNVIVYSAGTTSSGTTLATAGVLQSALDTAFNLWSGAEHQGTRVNTLSFAQGANNTNLAFNLNDCVNSIGFTQNLGTSIIAETEVGEVFTTTPGSAAGHYQCTTAPTVRDCPNQVCLVDTDIEFNTSNRFYTPSYTSPPIKYFDFQTVATHEIGHMIGLAHSGLANAIMFPYGDTGRGGILHSLALDDVIGSEALYPNSSILGVMGGITGTVTLAGSAAFGAHVVAIDSTNGNVVTDTLSDNEGNYKLRLFQGSYYVLVQPLASDSTGDSGTNGVTNLQNYSGFTSGYPGAANPTDYTGKYY